MGQDFAILVLIFVLTCSINCLDSSSRTANSVETPYQNSDPILSLSQTHTKFTIQSVITQRDREKAENPDWWRAYFAELLAAALLVVAAVVFLCWWRFTEKQYGPITVPVDEEGRPFTYGKYGRVSRANSTVTSPQIVVINPSRRSSSANFPLKCSKPACVCGPREQQKVREGDKGKGTKNKWRNNKTEENEVYAPPRKGQ